MKHFKEDLKSLYKNDRGGLVLMAVVFLCSLGLFIFSMTRLNPNSALVKIGYGDIGGYRDGSWDSMFVFPVLVLLFGILHNFLALKIYRERGAGMMKFFLVMTILLMIWTLIVVVRLSNEG